MAEWASTWFPGSCVIDWEFTHNPYEMGYHVGASSGGSAAAVAANFAMLGFAEDTVRYCPSR
jgi:amidase